jgi:hypothetical protein
MKNSLKTPIGGTFQSHITSPPFLKGSLYTLPLNGEGMGEGDVKGVIARSKTTKQSQDCDRRDFPVPHNQSSFPERESIHPPPERGRDG